MKQKVRMVNGLFNYLMGMALIAGSWLILSEGLLFGRLVLIVVGMASLVIGVSADYELGIAKLIHYKEYLVILMVLGLFLLVSPFVFGFYQQSYKLHLLLGSVQILAPYISYRIHFNRKRQLIHAHYR